MDIFDELSDEEYQFTPDYNQNPHKLTHPKTPLSQTTRYSRTLCRKVPECRIQSRCSAPIYLLPTARFVPVRVIIYRRYTLSTTYSSRHRRLCQFEHISVRGMSRRNKKATGVLLRAKTRDVHELQSTSSCNEQGRRETHELKLSVPPLKIISCRRRTVGEG